MSISPTQTQGSTSSSSSSSAYPQNPSSNHGHLLLPPQPPSQPPPSSSTLSQSPSSFSDPIPVTGSIPPSNTVSGSLASVAKDSGGSSKKVSELGTSSGEKGFSHENIRNHADDQVIGRGGFGSFQSRGKSSGTIGTPKNQKTSGSGNPQGTTTHSVGRKNQVMNGNHLLNFHYDPITRPQSRAPPPRRQQKIKPYNKDLFLQANYKFVVLDSGNYTPEKMDPDKMLQWEDIICVRYSTPFPVQCPICLEYPLCPQITSCGHIFCFPCILQYLLMGEEDHKGDCWKRCPLCFVMISPKELYTISIENVKQYSVGDTIDFMLLTRQKDSSAISQKNNQVTDGTPCFSDTANDSFSKLTFTSDVELSVRKAISDLDSWLVRADSGLVDDLEKLPYVCAAMEQLEQRKKYWNEARTSYSNTVYENTGRQTGTQAVLATSNATNFEHEDAFTQGALLTNNSDQNKWLGKLTPDNLDGGTCLAKSNDLVECENNPLSSSNDDSKNFQGDLNGSIDIKEEETYNFYQAVDGQHFILHPLNMKCLLHHYGTFDMLPYRISGKILQLETVTQTEAMRRRYRFLSHFSLTTTFQLCEIDMSEMLPPDALSPFMDEIKRRENQRKRLARKEEKEKIKAEAAASDYSMPMLSNFEQRYHGDSPTFSMDDFEALGSSPVTSSSPPTVWEGKLFSNVTRLGFAAAHDSPGLKIDEAHSSRSTEMTSQTPFVAGPSNAGAESFAKIISKEKSIESTEAPKMNEIGKKGKKPSRVLLSTAGGRRY